MTMLGRRKHSRFLLAQPIEGNLRLREEVAVEELNDHEVVLLSPEACRPQELVIVELAGHVRHRVNARVAESRPAMSDDGVIRHRLRLVIEERIGSLSRPAEGHS